MSKASNQRDALYRWQTYDIDKAGLSAVAWSGSYNDLNNKPTIPTVPKVAYYTVSTNASGVWTATITGFATVSYVDCIALNAAATAAGARIATLTSFSTTSATGTVCLANSITSILGLLGLGLAGAGVTVYVRVEGT